MSQHAREWLSLLTLFVALLPARPACAQTIADYSRAQRSLLENAMTQAAARSAGVGASMPAVAASAVASPARPLARGSLPALPPSVQVSGAFASSLGSVAEVLVNATPYLLGTGQGVPGTAWRVESVAVDRVVLSRRDGGVTAVDADGVRKIFPLPALR